MSAILNAAGAIVSEPKDNSFRIIVEIPADDLSYVLGIQNITSINIDWGDGEFDTGVTANNPSHTYLEAGTYEIAVSGRANTANFFGVDSVQFTTLVNAILTSGLITTSGIVVRDVLQSVANKISNKSSNEIDDKNI